MPKNENSKFFAQRGGQENVYLNGKVKWLKAKTLDNYGKWSVQVYPDLESMNKVHKLIADGLKNKLKKDDDGYYITFSRQPTLRKKDGTVVALESPVIEDADGNIIEGLVGNGSDCTVKLETYGGKSPGGFGEYRAARWAAVRVNNLIPYQRESLPSKAQQYQAQGLREEPKPVW